MKEIYERPMMYLEEFTPNQYVSTCYGDKSFDCLAGGEKDILSNILDSISCTSTGDTVVGWASGCTSVVYVDQGGTQYTTSSGTASNLGSYGSGYGGVAYYCTRATGSGTSTNGNWNYDTTSKTLTHNLTSGHGSNGKGAGDYHCMVAACKSTTSS